MDEKATVVDGQSRKPSKELKGSTPSDEKASGQQEDGRSTLAPVSFFKLFRCVFRLDEPESPYKGVLTVGLAPGV